MAKAKVQITAEDVIDIVESFGETADSNLLFRVPESYGVAIGDEIQEPVYGFQPLLKVTIGKAGRLCVERAIKLANEALGDDAYMDGYASIAGVGVAVRGFEHQYSGLSSTLDFKFNHNQIIAEAVRKRIRLGTKELG